MSGPARVAGTISREANRAQQEILINRNARSPERALRPRRFLLTVDWVENRVLHAGFCSGSTR